MRTAAAMVLVLSTACTAQRAKQVTATAAVVTVASGVIALGYGLKRNAILEPEEDNRAAERSAFLGWYVFLPSTIVTAGGLLTWAFLDGRSQRRTIEVADTAREDAAQAARSRAVLRDRAWQMTKQAREAAAAGDCVRVSELEVEIRAIDAELHATVFARDIAIRRCLAPAP